MQPKDAGINKPFDRILKAFVDEAPSVLLRLLGIVPAGDVVDIQPLRPETAPAVVLPDYVAVVRTASGERILFHAEFQSIYCQDVPRDIARYGGSLAWQHQLPVSSVLVMLRPDRCPTQIPEVGEYVIGSTRTTHPFRVIRLWELDPTPVLESDNPRLLPWTLLLKSTDQQVRHVASILSYQEDDEAIGRFLVLGGLRYHRNTLDEMLGGRKMSFTQAILDGSLVIQDLKEEAAAKAAVASTAAEARRFLRLLLRKQHPELQNMAEIDAISRAEDLEAIGEAILDSHSTDSIRSAILSAANSQTTA